MYTEPKEIIEAKNNGEITQGEMIHHLAHYPWDYGTIKSGEKWANSGSSWNELLEAVKDQTINAGEFMAIVYIILSEKLNC